MKASTLVFLITALIFVMLLGSCKQEDKSMHTYLLTEAQMIDITTDIQLIEAALNYRRNIGLEIVESRDLYYSQLFEKYDITPEVYDRNVIHYNRTPERMEYIYNEVLARLEALQKEVSSKPN
jgi:hypothetical protein